MQNRLYYGLTALKNGMTWKSYFAHNMASKLRVFIDFIAPTGIGLFAIYSIATTLTDPF